MNKFVYFMVVGLAFTVLQVATVEAVPATTGDDTHTGGAEDCTAEDTPALIRACEERRSTHAAGDAHSGMAPGTVALTIGDPLCVVAPALRDPGCPNAMPGTGATMAPPAGNGMNPMPGAVPMAPPAGGGDDGVALTIGDARCIVGAAMRDPRCPNANMP